MPPIPSKRNAFYAHPGTQEHSQYLRAMLEERQDWIIGESVFANGDPMPLDLFVPRDSYTPKLGKIAAEAVGAVQYKVEQIVPPGDPMSGDL